MRAVIGANAICRYNIYLRTAIETHTDDFGNRTRQFPDLARDLQSELGLKLVSERAAMLCYVVIQSANIRPVC